MKKLSILSAIFGLFFIGTAGAANITIYHSPHCPHCHHAREFISSTLIYEYPELQVSEVNVTEEAAMPLFQEALTKCEYESGGVPVMVIGEKCFQGYADFMGQEIRDAIEADMTEEAKATAAENKKALEANPEQFKADNASRTSAITEVKPEAAEPTAAPAELDQPMQFQGMLTQDVEEDNANQTSFWFYAFLVALIVALWAVLTRKKK